MRDEVDSYYPDTFTEFEAWWQTQNVTTDGVLERAFEEVAWKAWQAAYIFYRVDR